MSGILLPKRKLIGRRKFLGLSVAGLGATMLGGCDRLSESPKFEEFLGSAEGLTYRAQRLLGGRTSMAREFSVAELSPVFKVNGTHTPDRPTNMRRCRKKISPIGGSASMASSSGRSICRWRITRMPQRTQITRHDCVEGWSAIGKWTGAPLAEILKRPRLLPEARFAVFHCADIYEHASDGRPILRKHRPDRRLSSANNSRP